eukprot:190686-Prymnesium_polylepis.1
MIVNNNIPTTDVDRLILTGPQEFIAHWRGGSSVSLMPGIAGEGRPGSTASPHHWRPSFARQSSRAPAPPRRDSCRRRCSRRALRPSPIVGSARLTSA